MGAVRTWLLGVALTALAAGVATRLAPRGREQAAVRLAGGLLLAAALLAPLAGRDWSDPLLPAGAFSAPVEETAQDYRREQQEAFSSVIAARLETYIWDKAQELGLDCRARVHTSPSAGGIPLPDGATVTGPYSAELSVWLAEELGIPAEKQIWVEESAWSETESNES